MNKFNDPHSAIRSLMLLVVFLFSGCQSSSMQVSPVSSTIVPDLTIAIENTRTATLVPTQTLSPSPMVTETLEPPLPTAFYSGPFKMIVTIKEILSGHLEGLVSTSDDRIWLVTNQDVGKIEGTTLTVYLKEYKGKFAGIDSNSRVWIVNNDFSQISAWDGKTWTSYDGAAGWTSLTDESYPYVFGGQSDMLGRVWFATSKDVRVFDGGSWTVFNMQELGMAPPTYEDLQTRLSINIFQSGTVWVTECDWGGPGPFGGRGVRWFENGIWLGTSSPVASGCATAIAEDSMGNIWVGLDSNLWRYEPASDQWQEFSPPESPVSDMRFGFFDSLAIDSTDSLWATLVLCGGASCFGKSVLYRFKDNIWTQVGAASDYDSGFLGPFFDKNGNTWMNWTGGIYQIERDVPQLISPLAPRFAVQDQKGKLWLVADYEGQDMLWLLEE
ncbi:MAG: hypothetical protein CVU46_04215 [Chloroflexi bacterium HGW-Chloroflexi-8]|nr:MAG: hypothetical protein CVU46_04215 [Chloroflexi bacterium HGW-Chloroflexi-8]